jgi:hypothetical protein
VDVSISGSVGRQCQHTALNSRFHTSVLFVLYSISSFMVSPPINLPEQPLLYEHRYIHRSRLWFSFALYLFHWKLLWNDLLFCMHLLR